MTPCVDCDCPLPERAPGAPGRPRRCCAGCTRRRRADAERRRRARAGVDLGVSPAAWAALRVTDEVLAHVARHGAAHSADAEENR